MSGIIQNVQKRVWIFLDKVTEHPYDPAILPRVSTVKTQKFSFERTYAHHWHSSTTQDIKSIQLMGR